MSFYEFNGLVEYVEKSDSERIKVGDDYAGGIDYDRDTFQVQDSGSDTTYTGNGKLSFRAGSFALKGAPVDIRITVAARGDGTVVFDLSDDEAEIYLKLSVYTIPGSAVCDMEKLVFSGGPVQFDFGEVKGQKRTA